MAIEIKSAMLITSGISVLKPIPRRFCGFVKSIRSVHHLSTDSRDNSSFQNAALAIFARIGLFGRSTADSSRLHRYAEADKRMFRLSRKILGSKVLKSIRYHDHAIREYIRGICQPAAQERIISEYSKVFNMGQIEKITTDILILSLKGTNEVL